MTIAAYLIAAAIGSAIVLGVHGRGAVRQGAFPWLLDEVSKLHVQIVGTLAGFAFTGVVLVVTLVHGISGRAETSLEAVIAMFLVSYLFWVGSAFLISYLPHAGTSGDFVRRVHFSLASTIEYRTVFLSWFALVPLLQTNGLSRLLPLLYVLLAVSLLLGSLLVAMATDGLGLVFIKEIYFSAAVATGLAGAYWIVAAFVAPEVRSSYSTLSLAVIIFFINGLGFAFGALTGLASQYAGVRSFLERYGRRLILTDMQLTMGSLAFLWLAVVGAI